MNAAEDIALVSSKFFQRISKRRPSFSVTKYFQASEPGQSHRHQKTDWHWDAWEFHIPRFLSLFKELQTDSWNELDWVSPSSTFQKISRLHQCELTIIASYRTFFGIQRIISPFVSIYHLFTYYHIPSCTRKITTRPESLRQRKVMIKIS